MLSKSFLSLVIVVSLSLSPGEVLAQTGDETIAIIGTGDMGDSLGVKLAELGYDIVYGSRDPTGDKAQGVVAQTGNGARAVLQREAAQAGDIVILAVPWPAMETVAQNLGSLAGKIVIDISFPH